MRYAIGEIARKTELKIETVRYYERIGLIDAPPRTGGGHRAYDIDHLQRLGFVRRARDLGFSLAQVRDMLGLVDESDQTCDEVRDIASLHLAEVRQKIAGLKALENVLDDTIGRCTGGAAPDCPIISALMPEVD